MAGNAVIGALRVDLGLNSAEFSAGLKKAQAGLAGFGKAAAIGFAAAATAAVAAGAALAIAGKRAIDTADSMSKAAQKVGVATEALSRLNYAAGYADVSLEQLSGGLQKLSKNLSDVASGKGGSAATALQALGISATDSTGKLRDADQVFTDIADRFGRMEDSSTKTALAIQLFGKSGADLIPLLNSGKDGLQAMADESDRLGLTVSTKTGRAAEQFNDTLTKVERILDGVAMKIAEAALPALQELAEALADPQLAADAASIGTALVEGLSREAIPWIKTTVRELQGLQKAATDFANALNPDKATIERRYRQANGIPEPTMDPVGDGANWNDFSRQFRTDPIGNGASFGQLSGFRAPASSFTPPNFGGGGGGGNGSAEALASRLESLRASLRSEEEAESESYARRKEEIQKFYDDGVIQRGEYDELLLKAQGEHSEKMIEIAREQAEEEARIREALVDNVAGIFGSLSSIAESMGEKGLAASKAFGVAEAIVNTAQGITKALAQGGIFGFVGAAAVAAAGAAQISTILSTQKGSGSKPSVKGGASSAAVSNPTPSDRGGTAVNLTLMGGGRYSRDELQALFRDMNSALGDGFKLNVNPA